MNSGLSNDERYALMLRHLEDATSPEENRRLEEALRDSPEAQQQFAELLVQVVQLHSLGQEQKLAVFETDEPAAPVRGRRFPMKQWALAASAVGLIGIAAWFFAGRGRFGADSLVAMTPDATASTNGVARLTHSAGVVWADGVNADLDMGVGLSAGRLRLAAGVVELEFASKAQLVLEGPAELTLVSGGEAALQFGRLSAHVPPAARGFVVHSAENRIVDLGTEFGLAKPDKGPLKLEVFSGHVQFSKKGQEGVNELRGGEAVQFEKDRLRSLAADRTAYVSSEELRQREIAEVRARFEAWRDASRALAKDPATLVHFDFDGQEAGDRTLVNRARAAARPAQIMHCDWTEGRWSNKGALQFKRFGDRIHFNVPGRFSSVTYLAWVCVDETPNYFNGLSLSEQGHPGAVHWQILYQGSVEFAVRVRDRQVFSLEEMASPVEMGWERFRSRPVITPERTGRWIHMAAVYDCPNKLGATYVNGQKVQWKEIEQPMAVVIGDLDVGSWVPVNVSPTVWRRWASQNWRMIRRGFRGCMDEFTISSRAFSDDEIRRLYEVGRPSDSTRSIRFPEREGSDPFPPMDPMKEPREIASAVN